jgi:hypothetical protein
VGNPARTAPVDENWTCSRVSRPNQAARLSDPAASTLLLTHMTSPSRDQHLPAERQYIALYGRQFAHAHAAETQPLLAAAHADRLRPVCLCRPGGVAMYVAKIGTENDAGNDAKKYVVKRMPDSGLAHAHHCPSYLPPEALSGLGQVLGAAITEEADSGLTALRLGFRMSTTERAAPTAANTVAGSVGMADSVTGDANRLSMRAVLHYLWQEADLATWSPGMAGKRNWRIVSWYLRSAARGKHTLGQPLLTRLYVPEPFSAEKKTEIAVRRLAAWASLRQPGAGQRFMLLIGELKAIEPARFGHKLVIKHLPDAPLMLDDALLARLNRRFRDELDLWQLDEDGHLMVIATFSVGRGGLATAEEVSVVMTDRNWLPYESQADKLLLDVALDQHRRFTKSLRYNLAPDKPMASLVFTDTETPTAAFMLPSEEARDAVDALAAETGINLWTWVIGEDMPPLPPLTPRVATGPPRASK